MDDFWPSFDSGFVAGLRSMTACAALTWAASFGKTRTGWIAALGTPAFIKNDDARIPVLVWQAKKARLSPNLCWAR